MLIATLTFIFAVLAWEDPHGTRENQASLAGANTAQLMAAMVSGFEKNQGQFPAGIDFAVRRRESSILLSASGATIATRAPHRASRLQLSFIDSNSDARFQATQRLPQIRNVIKGRDPAKWRTGLSAYRRVRYFDIYPGVDLTYYLTHQGALEYDLILRPGVDPQTVRMRIQGSANMNLDSRGNLRLGSSSAQFVIHRPRVFQVIHGQRRFIAGSYRVNGDQVTFRLGAYSKTKTLIIDPAVSYASFLGGSNADSGYAVAADGNGNIYVTGETASTDLPIANAYASRKKGGLDAFVIKLAPGAKSILYATYFGGGGTDSGRSIAVDGNGSAYIAGYTSSSDFPVTTAAYGQRLLGQQMAFAAKFNSSGALQYSTLLGGSASNAAAGIAVDSVGQAYVCGWTSSGDFPVTAGALQSRYGGGYRDAFVTELNAAGSSLVYSTFVGGRGDDAATAIGVDTSGRVYATGYTDSSNFPLANPWQTRYGQGVDAFALKLNAGGASLVYSTYLGGLGFDAATSLALDAAGNLFVAGYTSSSDFPTLGNGYQVLPGGAYDGFLARVSATGTVTAATLMGGSGMDVFNGVTVDGGGRVWAVGQTNSSDFPVTVTASASSSNNAVVVEMDAALSQVIYSTTLGGSGDDKATGVAVGREILVTGTTGSLNFPATAGALATALRGVSDAFIAGFGNPAPPVPLSLSPPNGTSVSQSFTFQYADPNGATDIALIYILINSSLSIPGGCWLKYEPATSTLWITDTAATRWTGGVHPGTAGTLQNGICSTDTGRASASISGNTLTLTVQVTGVGGFSGPKGVYTYVQDAEVLFTDWRQVGTWTPGAPNRPPTAVSVSPSSGAGVSQTFTFTLADPDGSGDLALIYMMFNATLIWPGACVFQYHPPTNTVWITNTAVTLWLGGMHPGSPGTLQNDVCSSDPSQITVVSNGNNLDITIPVRFTPAFAGDKNVYAFAQDSTGVNNNFQQLGTWTTTYKNFPPVVNSVTPTSGTGNTQTFTFTFSDLNGANDITFMHMLFNSSMKLPGGCLLEYYRPTNTLWITDTAVTVWTGAVHPGTSSLLQNGTCSVDVAHSTALVSGNTIQVTMPVSFAAGFSGPKGIYAYVQDIAIGESGWQQVGNWTAGAPVNQPPAALSISPASGGGASQPFSFTVSDLNGTGDITLVYLLFNSSLTLQGSCWLQYHQPTNTVWITDTAITTWLGGVHPGSSTTLRNDVCSLDASRVTVSPAGNNLTINMPVSFANGFAGLKNSYVWVQNFALLDNNWQQLGNWTPH